MGTLNQILKYVRKRNWKTIDNNSVFGISVYAEPDAPLFEIFNKAVVVEGIYSSITFSVDLSISLQDKCFSNPINKLLKRFFSVNYLEKEKEKIVELNNHFDGQFDKKILNNFVFGCLNTPSIIFMEATTNSRVILLINLEIGIIRFSLTDSEHSGIHLPIHAWIEKSVVQLNNKNDNTFDRLLRIVKLSIDHPKLLFNNTLKYDFWFYDFVNTTEFNDRNNECLLRTELFFEGLLDFMRNLYGRESSSIDHRQKMIQRNENRRKIEVNWHIPEAEIGLIKSTYNKGCQISKRKETCLVEVRIKPRLVHSVNGGSWVFENLC